MRALRRKRHIAILLLVGLFVFNPVRFAEAAATITPATGGGAISADTVDGDYTSLTGPIISEELVSEVNTGTIILDVPSGFIFDTGGTLPTVLVTRTDGAGADTKNINNVPSGTSVAITSITTTQVTFTVTSDTSGGVKNSLTWQNVRVRPSAASPLASGNITKSGTSAISGITSGVTSLGTLTEIAGTPPPPPSSPPSADGASPSGGGGGVAPTSVVFSGRAYPGSKVEILRRSIQDEIYRNVPAEFSKISDDGVFYITYTGLIGGDYLFALRAEDKGGGKTGIIAFNMNLLSSDRFVAENIFFPPTIDFDNALVTLGKEIELAGYAAPILKVEIEIDGILKGETRSDENGLWSYATTTSSLRIGDHYARSRQIDEKGKASEFSVPRTFRLSLLASPRADLNNDNEVSIADLSIFLFRWGSGEKDLMAKIDMDDDGKIGISDFSIFLKAMRI